MRRSNQLSDAPISAQIDFWNKWNAETREEEIGLVSIDQRNVVLGWLKDIGQNDLNILDVGCGAGWLCVSLTAYGSVTGTDISDVVLARAATRNPQVKFIAGDFMSLDFDRTGYDVLVSLEVLSHVADQPAFVKKMSSLLRPGGHLMLATQNRPQLERNNIRPPMPGQIRQWVDQHELARLLNAEFEVLSLFSVTPQFNRGLLRVVNAKRLHGLLSRAGLGPISQGVKHLQELAGLGWTLMCLAKKRVLPVNGT